MKKILMSMRVTEANNYLEYRNSIAYEYISFFEELGFLIILIPNNSDYIEKYFDKDVALVVLTGGNNVNPILYQNKDILDDVYNDRDDTEYKLLSHSLENKVKVFGICRGFHLINVYFGGSLSHKIQDHVNKEHILLSDNQILSKQSSNSFHNQGIKKKNISNNLNIIAKCNDGIIEALINQEKTILGMQWHPERQKKEFDKKLILNFIKGKI